MRFLLPVLSLAILPALAPAQVGPADDARVVTAVYAQLVALPVPPGFKPAFEHEAKGAYLLELAPQAETADRWTQLVTLTGGQGLAATVSAERMGTELARGYKSACPQTFVAHGLPVPELASATKVFAGYLGCGSVAEHSEAMIFLVLKGREDIYTVQWAERGPPLDKPPEAAEAVWRPRLEILARTRICDRVAGDAAPFPACAR